MAELACLTNICVESGLISANILQIDFFQPLFSMLMHLLFVKLTFVEIRKKR